MENTFKILSGINRELNLSCKGNYRSLPLQQISVECVSKCLGRMPSSNSAFLNQSYQHYPVWLCCKPFLVWYQLEAALGEQQWASVKGDPLLCSFPQHLLCVGSLHCCSWLTAQRLGRLTRSEWCRGGSVLAPARQERLCRERALLMCSCTAKRFALKGDDAMVMAEGAAAMAVTRSPEMQVLCSHSCSLARRP